MRKQQKLALDRLKIILITSLFVFVILASLFFRKLVPVLNAVSVIGLLMGFYFVDQYFDLRFKNRHYILFVIIIFTGILLSPLYFTYPHYDKIQHFGNPILLASIVFFMVDKLNLSLKWKLVFVFFIIVAVVGMFEIGEYLGDLLFDFKLQGVFLRDITGADKFHILQSRIDDTMIDMTLGVIGALLYVITIALKNKHLLASNKLF